MLLDARLRERGGALQEAPAGTFGFCATVERIFVDRTQPGRGLPAGSGFVKPSARIAHARAVASQNQ